MVAGKFKYLAIGVLMLFVVGCTAATPKPSTPTPPADNIVRVDPPIKLNDFSLQNSAGGTTKLADWKGKFTVVTFGYTHCPDVCPVNLADFKQIRQVLDSVSSQLNLVFVSVDGARDTPDVLATHLKLFDNSILGLTGTDQSVLVLTQQFGVYYKLEKTKPDQTDYAVTHTASSFLVDKEGEIVRIYNYGFDPEVISKDIRSQIELK